MKSIIILSVTYLGFILLLIKGLLSQNEILQLVVKVSLILVLLLMYLLNSVGKKRNVGYIVMIFFVFIAQIFFIRSEVYLLYSVYCYFTVHVIFTAIVYMKYLKNKSTFDIFTFSFPFFLMFSVIYVLLEDLSFWWHIRVLIYGPICCVNGTVAALSYMETRNKRNLLLFIGVFSWLVVDALTIVQAFNLKEKIYYDIVVVLDAVANYLVCLGFVFGALQEEEDSLVVE